MLNPAGLMGFVWASFHGRMAPAGNKIAGLRPESVQGRI